MSSTNGTTTAPSTNMTDSNPAAATSSKGKGKAIDTALQLQDMSMDEDDDSSDEETGAEDDVPGTAADDLDDEEEEDDLHEIDTSNILSGGRRTRGKTIDFAKAAEKAGEDLVDDDDEDDEDFEADGGAEVGEEDVMRE